MPPRRRRERDESAEHLRVLRRRARTTSLPTPPARPSRMRRPRPTIRSSSTAASGSARRTSCRRSATRFAAQKEGGEGRLYHQRGVHERVHRRDPKQHADQIPQTLPPGRRAAHRRHPVPRRQGAHAGGVFPHLQHALRRPQTDRPLQRPAAVRNRESRDAARLAFRVGPDRRNAAAGHRDARSPFSARKAQAHGRASSSRRSCNFSPSASARTSAGSKAR